MDVAHPHARTRDQVVHHKRTEPRQPCGLQMFASSAMHGGRASLLKRLSVMGPPQVEEGEPVWNVARRMSPIHTCAQGTEWFTTSEQIGSHVDPGCSPVLPCVKVELICSRDSTYQALPMWRRGSRYGMLHVGCCPSTCVHKGPSDSPHANRATAATWTPAVRQFCHA